MGAGNVLIAAIIWSLTWITVLFAGTVIGPEITETPAMVRAVIDPPAGSTALMWMLPWLLSALQGDAAEQVCDCVTPRCLG